MNHSLFEKFLLALDEYPLAAVWRFALGFVIYPVADSIELPFLLVFATALFGLKIALAILRRLMPVSATVKDEWARRRQLGKIFDSYQWQKLLSIGAGVLAQLALMRSPVSPSPWIVGWICLVGGSFGLIFWIRIRRRSAVPQVTKI